MWVRTVADGEPVRRPMSVDRADATGIWFVGSLVARHDITPYRFMLHGGVAPYRCLNGVGLHRREVSDAFDFRVSTAPLPPAWLSTTVAYQIFPDRFDRGGGAWETPSWAHRSAWDDPVESSPERAVLQVFGGDLAGIVAHLEHLVTLGVNMVYLTPIFPAESSHRYNSSTFDEIDPLLGGDDAFAVLTAAAHAVGIRILADITTNHTGDTHEWFQAALKNPSAPERGFFYFEPNSDVYVAWYDIDTLPKLNHGSPELRRRLLSGADSIVAKWMKPPYSIDGSRVDVATMTGRMQGDDYCNQVARDMRGTMANIKPDSYLLAEHSYDANADLMGEGWHGTTNYAGFNRPVLSWLVAPDAPPSPWTPPRISASTGQSLTSLDVDGAFAVTE